MFHIVSQEHCASDLQLWKKGSYTVTSQKLVYQIFTSKILYLSNVLSLEFYRTCATRGESHLSTSIIGNMSFHRREAQVLSTSAHTTFTGRTEGKNTKIKKLKEDYSITK